MTVVRVVERLSGTVHCKTTTSCPVGQFQNWTKSPLSRVDSIFSLNIYVVHPKIH